MTQLTHFDEYGQAHMVDISDKQATRRIAVATGTIHMSKDAFELMNRNASKKGDVLGVARIAAIQGVKQTANLIPLCHPLPLTYVGVAFYPNEKQNTLEIQVTAETLGQTGVEMEALTGVNIGLLTVYDMLKAVDKGMRIEHVCLLQKHGGKSGVWKATQT